MESKRAKETFIIEVEVDWDKREVTIDGDKYLPETDTDTSPESEVEGGVSGKS
jgi:hypothetical protein